MISRVIRRQHEMIRSSVPLPVFCVALYGEISELYKGGYVELPEDVIKVWADNGYGRMVSRRHGI
ncbi:glycosyl hydrolase 115 family protein [Paenibacillus puerhi]|uniref:glycosyl hydrolase 115 family protein n=1 Tax=Paenibacillus puerhi TaxID=2692622 RepID=UPI0022A6A1EB|nr:glycosyl hydrolase 115 family protein [Paenibacillus puerhi]